VREILPRARRATGTAQGKRLAEYSGPIPRKGEEGRNKIATSRLSCRKRVKFSGGFTWDEEKLFRKKTVHQKVTVRGEMLEKTGGYDLKLLSRRGDHP